METTERIVESYCRYVKGLFTIPNIKCAGQYEIDLLAIDVSVTPIKRYHIETSVSISTNFSKLTAREYSPLLLKQRISKPQQRRTVGYFVERKFNAPGIHAELAKYGFVQGNYEKVIVTWGWEDAAKALADNSDIVLWDFRTILVEIEAICKSKTAYFIDDTLRTIQLLLRKT